MDYSPVQNGLQITKSGPGHGRIERQVDYIWLNYYPKHSVMSSQPSLPSPLIG